MAAKSHVHMQIIFPVNVMLVKADIRTTPRLRVVDGMSVNVSLTKAV